MLGGGEQSAGNGAIQLVIVIAAVACDAFKLGGVFTFQMTFASIGMAGGGGVAG